MFSKIFTIACIATATNAVSLTEEPTFPTTCDGLIEGHEALKAQCPGKLIDGPCADKLKRG